MPPKTPDFWYKPKNVKERLLPIALLPLAKLYGAVVRQRFDLYHPIPMGRPVICVGNVVAGGAGKTPVVMSLVDMLLERGYNPHILTRGYGGAEEGPLQVAPNRDTAEDVGDEALLLVAKAPTWVSKNRALGAQAAIDTGANVIVMDDGFQNPAMFKDFSLLVIDGAVGLGNGQVMPAGPLRENFADAIARADAVVLIGDDATGIADRIAAIRPVPLFRAALKPDADNLNLFGKHVFAFAGIGRPEKFKDSLIAAGAMLDGWGSFPDHYPYKTEDLVELVSAAEARGAMIVTTAKDHVRLPEELKEKIHTFRVHLEWQDSAPLMNLIAGVID